MKEFDFEMLRETLAIKLCPEEGYYPEDLTKSVACPVPEGEQPGAFRQKMHGIITEIVGRYGVGVMTSVSMSVPPEEKVMDMEDGHIAPRYFFVALIGHSLRNDVTAPHVTLGEGLAYPLHTNN